MQDNSLSEKEYHDMRDKGKYDDGCAVVTGRLWRGPHKGKYLVCFDFDNLIATDIFLKNTQPLFGCKSLDELSTKTIVEEHADAKGIRAHVYLITSLPITKHNGLIGDNDPTVPKMEVKSDSSTYMVCSPTVHKDGHPYKIIGTNEPLVLDDQQSKDLEKQIVRIYDTQNPNAANVNSNLPSELRLVAKTLKIGKNSTKISKGCRSNTLISFVRVVLNYHYKEKDIQDLREFVAEVNQKLCDPPLSEDELRSIWNRDVVYLLKDLEEGKDFGKDKNQERLTGNKNKTEFLAYKYTPKNQLYEAVIIEGTSHFLTIKNGKVVTEPFLEEETRVLRPPALEEYPSYIPYSFKDVQEVKKYIELINSQDFTLDGLLKAIREQVSKYIVHHEYVLDYITSLILFSYFQDKFPTVPYSMFVSDNGSGKSTIGNVFECFGYRCVNMTDPTTANIFRIFGTVEPGQCTLVLDEAEKIDQVQEMMSILKSGYENGKKVQRINPFGKQEHFQTFGLKIMLAERTPNSSVAKGVLDRTFIISNFKGRPMLDIKERKNGPDGKTEFSFLKNLLLVYRLKNFNSKIVDIETRLDGRDKELCKPLLQFFFGTIFQPRLENTLERLLDDKHLRKSNSLERDLLEIVDDLLRTQEPDENGIIEFAEIWNRLIEKTNGQVDEFKSNQLDTETYGRLYKRTVSNILRDRFGAEDPKHRNATKRCLCFDRKRIKDFLIEYTKENKPTRIVCTPLMNDSSDSSDSNFESLCNKFFSPFCDSIIETSKVDIEIVQKNRQKEHFTSRRKIVNNDIPEGSEISVITVTKVTDPQPYQEKIQRSYPHSDVWTCSNCNDRGDKWYMLKHPCKMNKKDSSMAG